MISMSPDNLLNLGGRNDHINRVLVTQTQFNEIIILQYRIEKITKVRPNGLDKNYVQ